MALLIRQPKFDLLPDSCAAGAPIWEANTPVGRFAYGTDLNGVHYWQGSGHMDLGTDLDSLEKAQEAAENAYFEAVRSHPVYSLLACP